MVKKYNLSDIEDGWQAETLLLLNLNKTVVISVDGHLWKVTLVKRTSDMNSLKKNSEVREVATCNRPTHM
jgi:hypothetical protein